MSGRIENYEDLMAWQKAMDLVEALYRATQAWPRAELYGLTNQARRAVVSVPANIAEGKGRFGAQEFLHFLSMALRGERRETGGESRCPWFLSPLAPRLSPRGQSAEVSRLISGLMRSLRSLSPPASRPSPRP